MALTLQSEVLKDESEKLNQIKKRIKDLVNMSHKALEMCDDASDRL